MEEEGCGWVGVVGWGDGGQPLLSASIREPRGDMGAGKTEGIKGGGGGQGSESALKESPLSPRVAHTLHHPLPSPLHLFSMQMCNPAAAEFLHMFFFTGPCHLFCTFPASTTIYGHFTLLMTICQNISFTDGRKKEDLNK